jgi:hypothetical protein
MAIANFGIVIAGASIPATDFDLSRYEFRHQHLKEVFRAPIALQAEAPGIRLQLLPERCEIVVSAPGNIQEDSKEVTNIANSLFEYVGERVVKAVGHNMQYVVDGTNGRKLESIAQLVNLNAAATLLDSTVVGADLTLYLRLDNESTTRVLIMSQADPSRLVLDFNVNFERDALAAKAAVEHLSTSLTRLDDLAGRLSTVLSSDGVQTI